jgi:hypothetical protein
MTREAAETFPTPDPERSRVVGSLVAARTGRCREWQPTLTSLQPRMTPRLPHFSPLRKPAYASTVQAWERAQGNHRTRLPGRSLRAGLQPPGTEP